MYDAVFPAAAETNTSVLAIQNGPQRSGFAPASAMCANEGNSPFQLSVGKPANVLIQLTDYTLSRRTKYMSSETIATRIQQKANHRWLVRSAAHQG